ncbi:MAG: hypothetical protein IT166_21185 [Bryobacterales bacterium]|nr:hypothetical protein [Bryobacterales bacterium]
MEAQSDELLAKNYLLLTLSEAERMKAQERLLIDEEFHTCLLAVEEDLLDLYARNLLDQQDRKQVEAHLVTVWGEDRLAFARAFAKARGNRRGRLRLTAASLAAAVICSVAAAWMWTSNRALKRLLDAERRELTEARMRAEAQPSVTLLLSPSRRRGVESEREIVLTPESRLVHLELELGEVSPGGRISARVEDQDGHAIWRQEGLPARSVGSGIGVADLWMPAQALGAGRYLVIAGEDEYRMAVKRK